MVETGGLENQNRILFQLIERTAETHANPSRSNNFRSCMNLDPDVLRFAKMHTRWAQK